ncbi:MAG: hypothetical protein AVDCRST_MAG08-3763, partial [uncultured Acetobacteraceae bacterium]
AYHPNHPGFRLRRARRCRSGPGAVECACPTPHAVRAARPARPHDGRAHRARGDDQPGRRRPHRDLRHGARPSGVEAGAAARERQRHARGDLRRGDAGHHGARQRRNAAPRPGRRRHVQCRVRPPL